MFTGLFNEIFSYFSFNPTLQHLALYMSTFLTYTIVIAILAFPSFLIYKFVKLFTEVI